MRVLLACVLVYIILLYIQTEYFFLPYFFLIYIYIYVALGILRALYVKYFDPPKIYDLEMQLRSTLTPIPVETVLDTAVSQQPVISTSDLEAGTSVVEEEDEDDYMTVDDEEEEEVVEEEEAAEGKLITAILYTYLLLVLAFIHILFTY